MKTSYPIWQRVGRYLAVGVLNTLIDVGLFAGLTGWLGLPTLAANTLAYSVGILNGYILNRLWTYGDRPGKTIGVQFSQFVTVSLVALMINNLVVGSLTPPLSMLISSGAGALLAKAIATGASLGWNFLLNHFWTFRSQAVKAVQPTR